VGGWKILRSRRVLRVVPHAIIHRAVENHNNCHNILYYFYHNFSHRSQPTFLIRANIALVQKKIFRASRTRLLFHATNDLMIGGARITRVQSQVTWAQPAWIIIMDRTRTTVGTALMDPSVTWVADVHQPPLPPTIDEPIEIREN
jgi:hypothetical protein